MRRPRALIIPLRLLRMLASFWVACGRWGWILARSARISPCCFSREARGLNLVQKQRVISRQLGRGGKGVAGSSAEVAGVQRAARQRGDRSVTGSSAEVAGVRRAAQQRWQECGGQLGMEAAGVWQAAQQRWQECGGQLGMEVTGL